MARPKKDSLVEEEVVVEEKKKKTNYEYISIDYIIENVPKSVSICPTLDVVMGGGLKEGSITILSGPPGLGKTTYGLGVVANGQKEGRVGVCAVIEHRLHYSLMRAIEGLQLDDKKLKIIASKEGDILSAEMFLEATEQAILQFPGSVVLIDSFSDLISAKEQESAYGAGFLGTESRKLEASFCRRISPIISVNKNIVIAIAHVNRGVGMYATNFEKVSRQSLYKSDVVLRCSKPKTFEIKEGEDIVGHRLSWDFIKYSFGRPPSTDVITHLKYGIGPDRIYDIISLGKDMSILEKEGSWYTLPDGKKAHGISGLYTLFKEEPEVCEDIYNRIKKILE